MMEVRIDKILEIYEKEISKHVKNKRKLYNFERYKMVNVVRIYRYLVEKNYSFGNYNIFLIKYPKYRVVMSLNMIDKIINHYVTRFYLLPNLEKKLDNRNVATRKKMGRDYGIKLIKKYLEKMKKEGDFYCLKIDISKYFYTIDHNVLKQILKKDLKVDEDYLFLCNIIDSTNKPYINEKIKQLKEIELQRTKRYKEVKGIPLYETGKGLPIGNMTSQFLSIYYLHELDHKIIRDFRIKYYVRYMDDFILFSKDKEELVRRKEEIEKILKEKYLLTVNLKKTKITHCKEGFSFCGYRFQVIGKKTRITVCKKTKERVKKRIKEVAFLYRKEKITLEQAFSSMSTYYYGFKYGSKKKMMRLVENYFFK